jgi:hypothetical protein
VRTTADRVRPGMEKKNSKMSAKSNRIPSAGHSNRQPSQSGNDRVGGSAAGNSQNRSNRMQAASGRPASQGKAAEPVHEEILVESASTATCVILCVQIFAHLPNIVD